MKSYFYLSVSVSLTMLFLISCTGSTLSNTLDGDECGNSGNSGLGESCTKTDDCACGLRCVDLKCMKDETADGDGPTDGDTTDGDTIDGDTIDGDTTDGDMIDGDANDGDTVDGDTIDGDATDGDTSDGDKTDGDMIDGDVQEDGDGDFCKSHVSTACDSGDVYWFDSCGTREEKKYECETAECIEGTCQTFTCSTHSERPSRLCKDPATGFEWQHSPPEGMEWAPAIIYCQNLTLDRGGWRLPNISELRTLVHGCTDIETDGACEVKDECSACGVDSDDTCLNTSCLESSVCGSISCSSGGGPNGCYRLSGLYGSCSDYWSTSLAEDREGFVWKIDFYGGSVGQKNVTASGVVRCVR